MCMILSKVECLILFLFAMQIFVYSLERVSLKILEFVSVSDDLDGTLKGVSHPLLCQFFLF